MHNNVSDSPKTPSFAGHRLLVIRFSSFGDIVQACGVPNAFHRRFPDSQVDWLVREDFKILLSTHPGINEVISFSRAQGIMGLIKLAWRLGARDYSHIYDAHNNLRSKIVMGILRSRHLLRRLRGQAGFRFLRRPKSRLRRFLYFRFRLPVLPSPFRGAESFHRPLKSWGISESVPSGPQFFIEAELPEGVRTRLQNESKPVIVLAASAAWQMKRWPTQHWIQLIQEMNHAFFVLLGGPEDKFLSQLEQAAPERTLNLAGKLSLSQSASLLKRAELVIANDTGLLHVADQMSRPTIALIGPTAFGYPSHPTSQTLEIDLYCKPCSKDGRGKCINSLYQRCMVEISPERVKKAADEVLKS